MPNSDSDYVRAMQKKHPNIVEREIAGRKHFKIWLWMLVFTDKKKSIQIEDLRNLLGGDLNQFVWFATQIQTLYSVLSDEDHKEANLLNVKFMNKNNIDHCLQFLQHDLRKAMYLFLKSDHTFGKPDTLLC